MSSLGLIQKITRLSIQNFSRDPHRPNLGSEFDQIKKLVNTITTSDLNLDPDLLIDQRKNTGTGKQKHGAPVLYMRIYEDADITICVFILKKGARLPLHDHPNMDGILKVIHGSIAIQSYTLCNSNSDDRRQLLGNVEPYSRIYPAVKHPCVQVTSSDPVCHVKPESHNLHEIRSVGGVAAFLDILSPPYGKDERLGVERDCHYFQEIDSGLENDLPNEKVYLINTITPADFFCDQIDYKGPQLNDLDLFSNGQ